MREAVDNTRKVLNILRGYYAGKGKPSVISYTQLSSLKKDTNKSVTDYVIRTETILIPLRNARQTVDDASIIAMILKSLSRHFDLFFINITVFMLGVNLTGKRDGAREEKLAMI